jgi:hypothetical protein
MPVQAVVAILNAVNTLRGDYYFQAGRAYGRGIAFAMVAGIFLSGISATVTTGPSAALFALVGGSVTEGAAAVPATIVIAVDTALVAYGGLVVAAALANELNDHLMVSYFSGKIPRPGSSGGGSGGGDGGTGGGGGNNNHANFIEQLKNMKDSSLRKTIKSLEENIQEHLDKIANNPASRDVPHWQSEIRTFQEQLDLARQEAIRRGIK